MPFLAGPLQRAFAAGTTVVTPNRRLARSLVALYDREARAGGRAVWPAATALPWDAWLKTLWRDALAAGVVPANARLRTPPQAAHAWSRIVSAQATQFIDPRGAAILAADAWTLVHAWGAGGASWRAWEGDDTADDCAAFARWANRYAHELADGGAIDLAELPDRICDWAGAIPSLRGAELVMAGFTEFAPQQERLLAAISAAGATVTREDTLPGAGGRIARARGASPRDEVARALAWARARALADPDAVIAIVVEDLAARRDEIRALADEILCPDLQWPGAEDAARPYNLSLGTALSDVPLVAAALDLLGWAEHSLPLGRAAALLRSPWIAVGPDAWMRRAGLEAEWLKEGRRTISIRTAIAALRDADRPLAERWANVVDSGRYPASGSPRQHAEAWQAWLAAMGWPGTRAPESAELQARAAWDETLASFATLGTVDARMSRIDALAALRAQLASAIFQPETPPAPIQIVGLLEAAGQPFDALWVAGLAAERWPPAPRPSPLLPVDWQRERNVPRASAASELAYATRLTASFARAAPEVVFSYATSDDDHPCTPSSLLPAVAEIDDAALAVPASTATVQFALRAPREYLVDDAAPPLAAGVLLRGGAGLVEAQGDCPFKAVAAYRLCAQTWPEPIDGLSALERGMLVHSTLAAFWRRVKTHAALLALSPEAQTATLDAAVAEAVEAFPATRWRAVSPLVKEGEAARIRALVTGWLDRFERTRPPFEVSAIEAALQFELGGLALRLRLDRVDTLEGGGAAIIDYKTGLVDQRRQVVRATAAGAAARRLHARASGGPSG